MRSNNIIKIVLASLIITGIVGFQAVNAHETGRKAVLKKIYQAPLPGVAGKEIIVVRLSGPPGFATPKHTHPGTFYVYVIAGELTVDMNGQSTLYKAGDFFPESSDVAMVGRNASASDDLEAIIFQIGDPGKPLMVPVE